MFVKRKKILSSKMIIYMDKMFFGAHNRLLLKLRVISPIQIICFFMICYKNNNQAINKC